MERMIKVVHQHLDAFDVLVLARPAPTIDLTTFQEVVGGLQADVESIMEMRGPEPETSPVELAEDIVLVVVLTTPTTPPEPREHAKRHRSSRTSSGEDACSRKKERTDLVAARRASSIDEETHHMMARELANAASSSIPEDVERSTIEGAMIDEGTEEHH